MDRETTRVLDAPEMMLRVRERSLDEQVRVRLALMARAPKVDPGAIRCGTWVWARDEAAQSVVGMDFSSGEVNVVVGPSPPLSCAAVAPRASVAPR